VIRRVANRAGLVGVGLALVGWGLVAALTVALTESGLATWPAWSSALLQVALLVFSAGLPGVGGLLVAFWVAARLWLGVRRAGDARS
jgi:hypothetical protein